MKTFKQITIVFIICIGLMSCNASDETLKIVTGSTGGTYYPIGSEIAEILSDNMDGYIVNAYTGNASVSNSNLILENAVDMALVQSNVSYWAYKGIGMFEEAPVSTIRGISSLYSEAIQIIVRSDSDIKSISELKGKRVNIGEVSSGNYFDSIAILEAYNLKESELQIYNHSFSEALELINNAEIDAVFITSGIPTTSVILMGSNIDIEILSIDESEIELLQINQPYYTKETIPANTYPGVDYDVTTLAVKALLVCSNELSEELVYNITKTFWNNNSSLKSTHEKGKSINIESSLDGMSILIHEGALKYYNEIGILNDN